MVTYNSAYRWWWVHYALLYVLVMDLVRSEP